MADYYQGHPYPENPKKERRKVITQEGAPYKCSVYTILVQAKSCGDDTKTYGKGEMHRGVSYEDV